MSVTIGAEPLLFVLIDNGAVDTADVHADPDSAFNRTKYKVPADKLTIVIGLVVLLAV